MDEEGSREAAVAGAGKPAVHAPAAAGVRLQKLIAAAGVASRRAAESLMREGRVTVNGVVASTPGAKADPAVDVVRVDGRRVDAGRRRRYLLLNKPRGVMTTRDDPERRRTVMQLLAGVRESVYPVGRLDYDSEGLLLLTNDGDLAARLTHPRHGIERVYEARVRGVPDAAALKRLAGGVVVDGRRTQPATARLVSAGRGRAGDQSVIRIGVAEGRKRQIRHMCESVGHPVVRLRRVAIGPIRDRTLRPGQFRDLKPGEVAALRRAAGGGAARPASALPARGPAGAAPARPAPPSPGPRRARR